MNSIDRLDLETIKCILDSIPSCIFFKNTDLKYVFSSHYWEQIAGRDEEGFDIYGKRDIDIRKDKENAKYAEEQDRVVLRTGKGCKYRIRTDIGGETKYFEIIKEPVRNKQDEITGIVGLINDVTETVLLQEESKYLAEIDSLTQVYNRKTGTEQIQRILRRDSRDKLFCMLDVNKFKRINDTYGHSAGDAILIKIAQALRNSIQCKDDVVMRLGGDEFIVFLNEIHTKRDIKRFIDRLFSQIDRISLEGHPEHATSISVGIVKSKNHDDFSTLYLKADEKMYEAKAKVGNTFVISEE